MYAFFVAILSRLDEDNSKTYLRKNNDNTNGNTFKNG